MVGGAERATVHTNTFASVSREANGEEKPWPNTGRTACGVSSVSGAIHRLTGWTRLESRGICGGRDSYSLAGFAPVHYPSSLPPSLSRKSGQEILLLLLSISDADDSNDNSTCDG